jgi:hypothetical protein
MKTLYIHDDPHLSPEEIQEAFPDIWILPAEGGFLTEDGCIVHEFRHIGVVLFKSLAKEVHRRIDVKSGFVEM